MIEYLSRPAATSGNGGIESQIKPKLDVTSILSLFNGLKGRE